MPQMKSKYHSRKIETEVGIFDSKKEYKRYLELLDLQKRGTIKGLKRQVPFELIPSQKIGGKVVERACTYKADFVYTFMGDQVVEDVKGFKTPEYVIKRKLMLWIHGIKVTEV